MLIFVLQPIGSQSLKFEEIDSETISVAEYEKKFRELLQFGLFMITDDAIKKQRFLNGLSEHIAKGVSRAYHPTYQAL